MEDLLAFINDKMAAAGIPYEFGAWHSAVTYPYCVGNYRADDYRYEDGCTTGTLTVDVWSRDSALSAVQTADRIAELFQNLQEIRDDLLFFINWTGSNTIPTGEMGLFRVEVSLSVTMWRGDRT